MSDFPFNNYESLKVAVLLSAEQSASLVPDCALLKQQIFDRTGIDISLSSLLQVYAQKASLFHPSLFTLDTLACYQNRGSWKDWCVSCDTKSALDSANLKWQLLKEKASKVSQFTLDALIHTTNLPQLPDVTHKAHLAERFGKLVVSGHNVQLLTTPTGGSGEMALTNWVEHILKDGGNDQVLFFSGNAAINVFLIEKDLLKWVLSLLGYSEGLDLPMLLAERKRNGGLFYLVIQDLEPALFKADQFSAILNQLTEIVWFFKAHTWFRLIVTALDVTQPETAALAII